MRISAKTKNRAFAFAGRNTGQYHDKIDHHYRGLFLFVISPVYGDLYKYYDENGILSLTDDLAQVPESQKSDAETVVKTETDPPPEAATDEPETQEKAAFKKRIEALNEETLKYREKTDAYEKRVKDYNARINAL